MGGLAGEPNGMPPLVRDIGVSPSGKILAILASNDCVYFYSIEKK